MESYSAGISHTPTPGSLRLHEKCSARYGNKTRRRTHRPQSASLLPSCCLHSMPCLFRSMTSGPAASMIMAKIPKHQPSPAPSASGCCDAMVAPAPMHLTMLYDAWTVADALGFRSVSSVPQSYRRACQRREPQNFFGLWVAGRLTVKMLEVAAPLMNCIIRGTEICYAPCQLGFILGNASATGRRHSLTVLSSRLMP